MRTIHTLILMASIAFVAGCGSGSPTGAAPNPIAPVGAGLEGEYTVVGVEFLGEPIPAAELEKGTPEERSVKIGKDTIEMSMTGSKRETLKYVIDPTKTPAHIDITMPEKDKKADVSHGIYKMDGGTLTLFVMGTKDAKNRPREFKTAKLDAKGDDKDEGVMIVTLKKK